MVPECARLAVSSFRSLHNYLLIRSFSCWYMIHPITVFFASDNFSFAGDDAPRAVFPYVVKRFALVTLNDKLIVPSSVDLDTLA